jgi:hypothetical protein
MQFEGWHALSIYISRMYMLIRSIFSKDDVPEGTSIEYVIGVKNILV